MTLNEFIGCRKALGRTLHLQDGIWWEEVKPFYCRPAYQFQVLSPDQAKPTLSRSVLGYSHQVSTMEEGNRTLDWMVLEGEDLTSFSLERLEGKKRNQVRKGLRSCEVRQITDIEPCLEEVRQINISQAQRHMATGTFSRPAKAYIEDADVWRNEFRHLFLAGGNQFWGAFADGRLVGYLASEQVGADLWINAVKTHTESLPLCVSDALHYTVLERAAASGTCHRVIHGGRDRESLLRFKEQYLFRLKAYPYFTARQHLFKIGMHAWRLFDSCRMGIQRIAHKGTS